jgi:RNA polymerase sigma factor (sigma-70 family)
MDGARLTPVLRHIRQLAHLAAADTPDDQLLKRFIRCRDADDFAALVRRHGPLVWRVCRRVLGHAQDAEDAFQVTFFILASRPRAIRKPAALSSWLHGVAFRVARKARARAEQRSTTDRVESVDPTAIDPARAADLRELGRVIEEEVHGLHEKYRLPLLLCYWEGATIEAAARRLGWPSGTAKTRLTRGRELLRGRLIGRGVGLPPGVMLTLLAPGGAEAVPARLVTRGARMLYSGGSAKLPTRGCKFTDAVPVAVRAKRATAMVLLTIAATVGAGVLATRSGLAKPPQLAVRPGPIVEAAISVDTDAPGSLTQNDFIREPLPPGAIARLGTTRFRHKDLVNFVAFFPDRLRVAAADWSEVCIWEVATGRKVRSIGGDFGQLLRGMCLSPDGKALLTLTQNGRDGIVQVWDPDSGRELRQFGCGRWSGMALAPDGRTVATYGQDEVHLWEVDTGKELRSLALPGQGRNVVIFSPDSRTLISGGDDKSIRFFDVSTGKEVRRFTDLSWPVTSVAVSPDGKTLAWIGATKIVSKTADSVAMLWFFRSEVHLVNLANGSEVGLLQVGGRPMPDFTLANPYPASLYGIHALAFSPNGKELITGGNDPELHVWNLQTRTDRKWPTGSVNALAFEPASGLLVMGAQLSVRICDSDGNEKSPTVQGHQASVSGAAFSHDGRTLATAGQDEICLWDPRTGRQRLRITAPVVAPGSPTWSSDSRVLFSACLDSTLRFWDASTGQELRRIDKVSSYWPLAVSPDGKIVACAITSQEARVTELATGREISRLSFTGAPHLAFAPDGKRLLAWTRDKRARVMDSSTGRELRSFAAGEDQQTNAVAFSPDGKLLALGGQNPEVLLYDTTTGEIIRRVTELPGSISSVAFSPDSRVLVAGGPDAGTIALIEVATGKVRRQLAGQQGKILDMAIAPDGTLLASAAADTTILVWDLQTPPGGRRGNPKRLTDLDLAKCWDDLADEDGGKSYRAVAALAVVPEQAVAYLAQRLRPAANIDREKQKQVVQLITELDADDFAVRENAARELSRRGQAAEQALRAALEGSPSPEVRQRAETLLRKMSQQPPGHERLRLLRAVEVLELIGNLDARRLLETLASGAAEARLTQDAKDSLARLAKRTAAGR